MDIESFIIQNLAAVLDVPVAAQRQKNARQYIVVEKTGSDRENHVSMAAITVQSYAPTQAEASELNELAIAAMDDLVLYNDISSVKLVTDYHFPDVEPAQERYQALFEIYYKR